jgi:hypothetical protein
MSCRCLSNPATLTNSSNIGRQGCSNSDLSDFTFGTAQGSHIEVLEATNVYLPTIGELDLVSISFLNIDVSNFARQANGNPSADIQHSIFPDEANITSSKAGFSSANNQDFSMYNELKVNSSTGINWLARSPARDSAGP